MVLIDADLVESEIAPRWKTNSSGSADENLKRGAMPRSSHSLILVLIFLLPYYRSFDLLKPVE